MQKPTKVTIVYILIILTYQHTIHIYHHKDSFEHHLPRAQFMAESGDNVECTAPKLSINLVSNCQTNGQGHVHGVIFSVGLLRFGYEYRIAVS